MSNSDAGSETSAEVKIEPTGPHERAAKSSQSGTPKQRKRIPRKTTTVKEEMQEPKKVKREVPEGPVGPHHCKLCADSFFTDSELVHHEKTKHADVEVKSIFFLILVKN